MTGLCSYIGKQIIRRKGLSLLFIVLPMLSIVSVSLIGSSIAKKRNAMETVYESADVRCVMVKKENSQIMDMQRSLMNTVVEELEQEGLLTDLNAESMIRCDITVGETIWKNEWMGGVMSMEGFPEIHNFGSPSVEWLSGYSDSFFEKKYASAEEYAKSPEIVVAGNFAAAAQLKVGDILDCVSIVDGFSYEAVRIVGILTDPYAAESVLVPQDVIAHQTESATLDVYFYKDVYFSIPHEKNIEYEAVVDTIEKRLMHPDATILKELELVVFDEELQTAIKPLGQTIKVLEILYPVLIVVFCLCEAGATGLFVTLRRKELQIMRMLGTPGRQIRLAVCGELLLTGLFGTIQGTGVHIVFSGVSDQNGGMEAVKCALFGVLLTLIGTGTALVMMAVKKRGITRREK